MEYLSRFVCLVALAFLIVFAGCTQTAEPEKAEEKEKPEAAANPLQGAWSVASQISPDGKTKIDPAQAGLIIFTEKHYSAVHNPTGDPRPDSKKAFGPTSEEKVAQYDSIIVNSGTYTVSDKEVTFQPMIAKSPEFVGGSSKVDFEITGDELTITWKTVTAKNGDAPENFTAGGVTKLKRVE